MGILNDQQFADHINDPRIGGASRSGRTHREPPNRGYMVAVPGTGREGIPLPVSAQHIHEHEREHAPLLSRPGRYQGGWREDHPDGSATASVEVSQHFIGASKAITVGEQRGEHAIWDLKNSQNLWLHRGDRPSNGKPSLLMVVPPHLIPEIHEQGIARADAIRARNAAHGPK